MAQLLKNPSHFDWWPVDKVMLGFFALAVATILFDWQAVPGAGMLIGLHLAGALLIFAAARYPKNRVAYVFHHWYPLLYVASCYREMSILIPAMRHQGADALLAHWDFVIWGANPTVWLERLRSPALAEILQLVYSAFIPAVLLAAAIFWMQGRHREFRYYGFLIALGFLASYIGYAVVPARGPRIFLAHLDHYRLQGLWLFDWLRATLDQLERPSYDCFPSGHTELTILAWWGTRLISKRLFRIMFLYTSGVIFATVYLRYHYTVDVLAGAVLAWALIQATPRIYEGLGGESAA